MSTLDAAELRERLTECANSMRETRQAWVNAWRREREPFGPTIYDAVDTQGHPLLAGMLAAEAQVLAALVQLGPEPDPEPTEPEQPPYPPYVDPPGLRPRANPTAAPPYGWP